MNSERIASYVNVAEERLARWIGVDLTRGGVASTVRRHVETRARALGEGKGTLDRIAHKAPQSPR